ncbi:hypothetical protein DL768_010418 [Monosporascus sp. mg162]|nr:hypothetical protein DL768_010418 [Monosporascus sp. mg162]
MASDESYCFWRNKYAWKTGEIPLERYLRNGLSHVFAGVHHSEDERLGETDVARWAFEDIVMAGIKVCMMHFRGDLGPSTPSPPPPEAEDALVEMLLKCESGSLDILRSVDQSRGTSILYTPIFRQLIVAMALSRGNRELAKYMINQYPPGPGHELLFSPEKDGPTTNTSLIKFGERSALSHPFFKGQDDNGCEIWSAMIRSGWAAPRKYMLAWAATSPSVGAGIELLKLLAEHDVKLERKAVWSAIAFGQLPLLDYVLAQYIPDNGDPLTCSIDEAEAHEFLKSAVRKKHGGIEQIELLFKHGINDINWVHKLDRRDPKNRIGSRDLVEMELNANVPEQTPLHVAAACGNVEAVEWLIKRGALPLRDYLGNTPYDTAKTMKQEEAMAVFAKHGWKLSER